MSTTRTAGLIVAAVGGAFALGGGALTGLHVSERDRDGYYSTSSIPVRSHGYAVTSTKLGLEGIDGALARDIVGTVRVRVDPDGGAPVFVGIASKRSVDHYLGGVARTVVDDFDESTADLTDHPGHALPALPASKPFWRSSATGTGPQTLEFKPRNGDWRVVVMNTAGTRGVSATLKMGAKTDMLLWIGLPLLGLGLVGMGTGLAVAARRERDTGVPTGEHTDVTGEA